MSRVVAGFRNVARRHPRVSAYGAILIACAVALAAERAMNAAGLHLPSFMMFSPIICAAAVLLGLWAGLFATISILVLVLAVGGVSLTTAPPLVFAGLGVAVSFGGDWMFRRRKRGDEGLRVLAEREAHLRSIFDTAPDGLIVIDERGIMRSYSAAAERMFGWSASEVLGRNVSLLMSEPFRTSHDEYLRRYLDTGERRIIGIGRIVVGERKDGSSFPVELAVGEVRSERGRFFTGFVRDLSERQATEARLQELQTELIQVSRLTALGEMASALAHELNQPLSAIANYLSGAKHLFAKSGQQDERALEALEKASDQALRAGEIIRRLRDFLARGEPERRVESLSRLVREACALALVGAKEHAVRVHYALSAEHDQVLVDRVPIQQVVINLVRNALDAMGESTRRELLISSTRQQDGALVVSVADTGAGVDPTAAERLFQPFVTTKSDGMGVGLSISRTIIEAHGGRIWAEPNPGGGAIFKFSVRAAPEVADVA